MLKTFFFCSQNKPDRLGFSWTAVTDNLH